MNGGAIFLHSCVVIGKISTDIYDALRSHSAIAELLVTRIVGLMAEHEIHVVLVSVQHHSVPGRMT